MVLPLSSSHSGQSQMCSDGHLGCQERTQRPEKMNIRHVWSGGRCDRNGGQRALHCLECQEWGSKRSSLSRIHGFSHGLTCFLLSRTFCLTSNPHLNHFTMFLLIWSVLHGLLSLLLGACEGHPSHVFFKFPPKEKKGTFGNMNFKQFGYKAWILIFFFF